MLTPYACKVAFKRFVNNIAVQAVETSLIAKLGSIFSPIRVLNLASNIITTVAGESNESYTKRKALTNRLDVLMQGSEICNRFVVGSSHGMSLSPSLESTSQVRTLRYSRRRASIYGDPINQFTFSSSFVSVF